MIGNEFENFLKIDASNEKLIGKINHCALDTLTKRKKSRIVLKTKMINK